MANHLNVEDTIEIHNLIASYAWSVSLRDTNSLKALFTADGVLDDHVAHWKGCGSESIRKYVEGKEIEIYQSGQHFTDHIMIDSLPDANYCRVSTYWQVIGSNENGAVPILQGSYDDICVKNADGCWRFLQKTVLDWRGPDQPWFAPQGKNPEEW